MGCCRGLCLFFLLLLASQPHDMPSCAHARPFPFIDQAKYVKVLTSLGMVCRCCDGAAAGGGCRSKWEGTCGKLECRPWKFF